MTPRRVSHDRRAVRPFLRWIVPSVVILLAVAGSGDSAGSGPTTSTGAHVTKSVPFVRESIDEIRALAPLRSRAVPGDRVIPRHRIPRRSNATGDAGALLAVPDLAAPFFASSPAPSAPVLDSSFAGLGNPPHGQDVIPPDTMGAAGLNHLVSILNSDFGVFDKAGNRLQIVDLQAFWFSLGIEAGRPANFPFDPKILYDQYSDRFVAVTLGGKSAPGSWVMIAVSASSDPMGIWNKWAIPADIDNGVLQTFNSADYPGLGVDQFNVYVTSNMFDNTGGGQYGKVWVIPKTQLLTTPGPTLTRFEFHGPFLSGFSRQPAHTFGTAPAEYLVSEGPSGSSTQLLLTRIDNASTIPVLQPPVPVTVAAYVSTGTTPGAPQLGNDNTIDTSDTRVLNVVYRNGSVWATHHVVGPSGKVEVAWYRINPGSGTVQSQGRVTDPNRWFYYPSIAVNKDNVAAIGFSGSSFFEYVGGYYTVIQPTGAAEAVALLKAGDAPYFKIFSGNDNRWGDFSATMVDPTDDTSFWTLQEYAMTHDTFIDINNNVVDRSQWGTWWGKFTPGPDQAPPLPPSPPPPSGGGGGGGGGGCLSIARGGGPPDVTSLVFVGILLLPACALGLRRFSRRQERTVPIRHPLC
jgi:hypothetical protein